MLQEEPQQMIFKFLFLFGWCMLSQRFANVRKFRWPFRHFAWFLQRYFVVVSRWNTAHKHTTCPSLPPSCSHEAGMRIARKMAKMIFFEILFFWEFASKCMIFANVQKSCKKWPLFGLFRDGAWEWLGGGDLCPQFNSTPGKQLSGGRGASYSLKASFWVQQWSPKRTLTEFIAWFVIKSRGVRRLCFFLTKLPQAVSFIKTAFSRRIQDRTGVTPYWFWTLVLSVRKGFGCGVHLTFGPLVLLQIKM